MKRAVVFAADESDDSAEPAQAALRASLSADPTRPVFVFRDGAPSAATPTPGGDEAKREVGGYEAARAWILGADAPPRPIPLHQPSRKIRFVSPRRHARVAQPPERAVFVKTSLRGWDEPRLEAWLATRPDLAVAAILRNPWELDFPEYASESAAAAAARGFAALTRRGGAVIGLESCVRAKTPGARIERAPSELACAPRAPLDAALAATPFLVCAGPLEARANALLLLQVWRELGRAGVKAPKLVLVGARGAQIDDLAPMLDWAQALRPHVYEAGPMNGADLRRLLAHARALLAPAFAAPDAALLRDAGALGVKTFASSIPCFRESGAQGMEFLDPLDGPGWRAAVLRAATAPARRASDAADLPRWSDWSARLLAFLDGL